MRAEEKQGKQEKSIDKFALAALGVSIVAALFTGGLYAIAYCSYVYNTSPGEIHPLEPSGYAIVREIPPHPSDHIVIPLEWENTGGINQMSLLINSSSTMARITKYALFSKKN